MAEDNLSVRSALAAHPLFATCSPPEVDRLSRVATDLVVEPGYVLTREGRRGYELFLVLDGTATSSVGGAPVETLASGDHFGTPGPGGSTTCGATVVAATAMRLVAIDTRELNAALAIRSSGVDAPLATTEG